MLRVVPDEKFLLNNINNNDLYVDTEDIPEDACSLTELKQEPKVLKIKY